MVALQKKAMAVYEFIRTNLYLTPSDLRVNGGAFSSTLLWTLLNCMLNTNALLVGEYGTGKTSIAELVGCIVTGMPLNAVIHCEVRASPETTEAAVIGRLHLGELNRGQEKAVWALFAKSPVHIVDELPRLPEIRQALLLEGIRKGQWLYLGQLLQTEKSALFATANWEELGGSFDITPALRDRFAVAVETLYAGARTTARIAELNADEKVKDLELNWGCEEAVRLLNQEYDAAALSGFRDEFKHHLSQRGVPTLSENEIRDARERIGQVALSPEAQLFFEFLTSSLNFCIRTGMKRSARFGEGQMGTDCPQDCRFRNTACSRILNGGSRRKEGDIRLFAKALAWLLGDGKVSVAHVMTVAPFALWHRSTFASGFLAGLKGQQRAMPLHLEAAHQYIEELHAEFRRRKEIFVEAIRFLDARPAGTPHDGILIGGKTYAEKDLPHPFLADCSRYARAA